MKTKVLITPWFGEEPPWMPQYWENAERLRAQGFDFLLEHDEEAFRDRIRDKLGIEPPLFAGTGKIHDYRPALGFLFAEEVAEADFDYWGHTDFDCVYGRVERFFDPHVEVQTDCAYRYLAGPWTLHRNTEATRECFMDVPDCWDQFERSDVTGWQETTFSKAAERRFNVLFTDRHAHTQPELLGWDGDRLMHGEREIPFFHFRRTKVWPL